MDNQYTDEYILNFMEEQTPETVVVLLGLTSKEIVSEFIDVVLELRPQIIAVIEEENDNL